MTQVAKIEDYASLQTAIADTLDRTDLTTTIQMWIQLVEADVNRKLREDKRTARASAPGAANDPDVALPCDWLESRSVKVDGFQVVWQPLDSLDLMRKVANETSILPPNTLYFAYTSHNITFFPTPTDDYTVWMEYFQKVPPLADQEAGYNWLLMEAPDVYLYGALIHSAPYLRDDSRISLWEGLYGSALMQLDISAHEAAQSGSRISRKVGFRF